MTKDLLTIRNNQIDRIRRVISSVPSGGFGIIGKINQSLRLVSVGDGLVVVEGFRDIPIIFDKIIQELVAAQEERDSSRRKLNVAKRKLDELESRGLVVPSSQPVLKDTPETVRTANEFLEKTLIEMDSLKKELATMTEENFREKEALISEVVKYNKQIHDKERELAEAHAELEKLRGGPSRDQPIITTLISGHTSPVISVSNSLKSSPSIASIASLRATHESAFDELKLNDAHREIAELQSALNSTEREMKNVKSRVSDLSTKEIELARARRELIEKDTKIISLERLLQIKATEIESLRARSVATATAVAATSSAEAFQLRQMTDQLKDNMETINQLHADLEQVSSRVMTDEQIIGDSREELAALTAQNFQLESDLAKIKVHCERTESLVAGKDTAITNLRSDVDSLLAKLKKQSEEMDDLQLQIANRDTKLLAGETGNSELRGELAGARNRIRELESTADQLRESLKKSENFVADSVAKAASIEAHLAVKGKDIASKELEISSLNSRVAELTPKCRELEMSLVGAERVAVEKSEINLTRIGALESQLSTLREESFSQSIAMNRLETELGIQRTRNEALVGERESLNKMVREKISLLSMSEESMAAVLVEKAKLEAAVRELNSRVLEMESETCANQKLTVLRNEAETRENILTMLRRENESVQLSLAETRRKLQTTQMELDRRSNIISDLEEKCLQLEQERDLFSVQLLRSARIETPVFAAAVAGPPTTSVFDTLSAWNTKQQAVADKPVLDGGDSPWSDEDRAAILAEDASVGRVERETYEAELFMANEEIDRLRKLIGTCLSIEEARMLKDDISDIAVFLASVVGDENCVDDDDTVVDYRLLATKISHIRMYIEKLLSSSMESLSDVAVRVLPGGLFGARIRELENDNKNLQYRLNNVESSTIEADSQMDNAKARIEDMSQQLVSRDDEIRALRRDAEILTAQLVKRDLDASASYDESMHLKEELVHVNIALSVLREKFDMEIAARDSLTTKHEAEISMWREKLKRSEEQSDERVEGIIAIGESRRLAMESQILEQRKEIEKLELTIRDNKKEFEQSMKEKEDEVKNLRVVVHSLDEEITLTENVHDAEMEILEDTVKETVALLTESVEQVTGQQEIVFQATLDEIKIASNETVDLLESTIELKNHDIITQQYQIDKLLVEVKELTESKLAHQKHIQEVTSSMNNERQLLIQHEENRVSQVVALYVGKLEAINLQLLEKDKMIESVLRMADEQQGILAHRLAERDQMVASLEEERNILRQKICNLQSSLDIGTVQAEEALILRSSELETKIFNLSDSLHTELVEAKISVDTISKQLEATDKTFQSHYGVGEVHENVEELRASVLMSRKLAQEAQEELSKSEANLKAAKSEISLLKTRIASLLSENQEHQFQLELVDADLAIKATEALRRSASNSSAVSSTPDTPSQATGFSPVVSSSRFATGLSRVPAFGLPPPQRSLSRASSAVSLNESAIMVSADSRDADIETLRGFVAARDKQVKSLLKFEQILKLEISNLSGVIAANQATVAEAEANKARVEFLTRQLEKFTIATTTINSSHVSGESLTIDKNSIESTHRLEEELLLAKVSDSEKNAVIESLRISEARLTDKVRVMQVQLVELDELRDKVLSLEERLGGSEIAHEPDVTREYQRPTSVQELLIDDGQIQRLKTDSKIHEDVQRHLAVQTEQVIILHAQIESMIREKSALEESCIKLAAEKYSSDIRLKEVCDELEETKTTNFELESMVVELNKKISQLEIMVVEAESRINELIDVRDPEIRLGDSTENLNDLQLIVDSLETRLDTPSPGPEVSISGGYVVPTFDGLTDLLSNLSQSRSELEEILRTFSYMEAASTVTSAKARKVSESKDKARIVHITESIGRFQKHLLSIEEALQKLKEEKSGYEVVMSRKVESLTATLSREKSRRRDIQQTAKKLCAKTTDLCQKYLALASSMHP